MTYQTVLIDADLVVYRTAAAVEKETRWPDGVWTYTADEKDGIKLLKSKIEEIIKNTKAKSYLLCFSDETTNFRKTILPTYKGNRTDIRRPLLLKALRNYCLTEHPTTEFPYVEADDVMGILATQNEGCIIATMDKDLSQIPADIYHLETKTISKADHRDCAYLFYKQVITGDVTDGYTGCPGLGEAAFEEIYRDRPVWVQYEHTFASGSRKGQTETRWKKIIDTTGGITIWESIVSHYEKAGLTEADALQQARVAYILQSRNYLDSGTTIEDTIKLWEPDRDSKR